MKYAVVLATLVACVAAQGSDPAAVACVDKCLKAKPDLKCQDATDSACVCNDEGVRNHLITCVPTECPDKVAALIAFQTTECPKFPPGSSSGASSSAADAVSSATSEASTAVASATDAASSAVSSATDAASSAVESATSAAKNGTASATSAAGPAATTSATGAAGKLAVGSAFGVVAAAAALLL